MSVLVDPTVQNGLRRISNSPYPAGSLEQMLLNIDIGEVIEKEMERQHGVAAEYVRDFKVNFSV